ncbi:alpha/beta hydrolase [Marinobacter hydrocarbonoclasticus]|nr:alpha/beta hydrolase [Marinobacter nauticus]
MSYGSLAAPPSLEEWRAAGDTFCWRHHAIFFRYQPNPGKPVLVLVHGFPSAGWDWWALWSTLSEHYQLVAPDLLGFGLSDKPHPYRYRIADQAQMVLALLSHLGVQQAHLLAHDYGDTVAQELLARQREGSAPVQWQAVTLLNGGLFPEAHHPLLVQRLMAGPLGPMLAGLLGRSRFDQSLRRIWGQHPPSPQELDTLWQLLIHRNGKRVLPALLQYIKERRRYRQRWVGALEQTAVPVTLIDGLADPISGRSLVTRFAELCPQHRLVTLTGVGHYPQLEAPEQVLQSMRLPD